MIGIQEIAVYIPNQYELNNAKQELFDVDEVYIREKIGVLQKRERPKRRKPLTCAAVPMKH